MRTFVFGFLAVAALSAPAAAQQFQQTEPALPATDVTAAQVAAFLKALPPGKVTDAPIRIVDVGGPHVGVYGVFRPKMMPGDALLHDTLTTEIYYIISGGGTLTTGGKVAGIQKQEGAAAASGLRGDHIEGGVARHVTKGDIIIIPGRTPHMWSNLDSDLNYLIFRPDPKGESKLK